MKKINRKSKKGFTLIELLVVMGIIGILSAIMLPKFTGFTDKAKEKVVISDARAIYTEISVNYAENGTYPAKVDLEGADSNGKGKLVTDLGLEGQVSGYDATKGNFKYTKDNFTVTYENGKYINVAKSTTEGNSQETP